MNHLKDERKCDEKISVCVCIKKFFDDSKLVEFKAAAQNNL